MAKITVETEKYFEVSTPVNETWKILSQTEQAVSHYPKLESIENIEGNKWVWKLEKIGLKNFYHQIVYAVEYHFDEEAGTIRWEPLPELGNSIISGAFEITETENGSQVRLTTTGEMDMPIPKLFRSMAVAFIEKEFDSHISQFAQNLQKEIG